MFYPFPFFVGSVSIRSPVFLHAELHVSAGVVVVRLPRGGIVCYVLTDLVPFTFVPDDMLVVIALPHGAAWCSSQDVDAFGGGGLELPDDRSDGPRRGSASTIWHIGDRPGRPYWNGVPWLGESLLEVRVLGSRGVPSGLCLQCSYDLPAECG